MSVVKPISAEIPRPIKKRYIGMPQSAICTPAPGLQLATVLEFNSCFAAPYQTFKYGTCYDESNGMITNADFRFLLELSCRMTTAEDIWWQVAGPVSCRMESEFKRAIREIPWEYFGGGSIQLKVESFRSRLYHESMLKELVSAELVKKGLSVSPSGSERLLIEMAEDRLSVRIAMGGRPLYQRGYREQMVGDAPIKENIAQSLIRLFSVWLKKSSQILQKLSWFMYHLLEAGR